MSETYPCHYSSTALISVVGSAQAIVYALCVEKDMSKWRLGWNLTLITAAYMVRNRSIAFSFFFLLYTTHSLHQLIACMRMHVGSICIRNDVGVHHAVREDARPAVRLRFQPLAARARRPCRILVSQREAALGKV